ncbi:non-hydrolyzing UDP-N-acetylglucosamine 2-epimerase [Thermodesulfobacteriota bacterium]
MAKVLTVVGARPQFIKMAPVSRVLRTAFAEIVVHTGQHYDSEMSKIFFDQLGIPAPDRNLEVGSMRHGRQTGRMLIGLEEAMIEASPDFVLLYGDTNSTLAGALAAAKLHIPIAHVEAGLRSYDRKMPEEINRVVTDELSTLLFCPTETAVDNLSIENIRSGVHRVGDVMLDALQYNIPIALERSAVMERFGLTEKGYLLCTIHRPQNTDERDTLASIMDALIASGETVVFPVHPRTRKFLMNFGLWEGLEAADNVKAVDPVGYLDFLVLEKNARMIVTDSGGIQKEAFILEVPCVTVRDSTEWTETTEAGWNILVDPDAKAIVEQIGRFAPSGERSEPYGDGRAGQRIVERLEESLAD